MSDTISITAVAQDNTGVDYVKFYLNGQLIATDGSSPYSTSLDTTQLNPGTYVIESLATDLSGNVSAGDSITVFVEEVVIIADTSAPVVTITSPSAGENLADKTTVTGNASDENGITTIRIFVDGEQVKTYTGEVFTWRWNTRKVKSGAHRIRVEAGDPAGNIGSDEIVVYK